MNPIGIDSNSSKSFETTALNPMALKTPNKPLAAKGRKVNDFENDPIYKAIKKQGSGNRPVIVPRSLWSLTPAISASAISGIIGIGLSQTFPASILTLNVPLLPLTCSVPLFIIPSAIIIAKTIQTLYNSVNEIRSRSVRCVSGLYSLKREELEVEYGDIAFVGVNQSLFERLFKIGTVVVSTGASIHPEIKMKGRKYPKKYAYMINRRRVNARRRQQTPP
jgi:hypothetical protein